MIIKIVSIFLIFSSYSFGNNPEKKLEIFAVVDKEIITNIDIDNIVSIMCIKDLKFKKFKNNCMERNRQHAIHLLVNTKIQKSYFSKIENKLENIDFNGPDFRSFLKQNEAQFGFNKELASKLNIDYDLFFEYVKNQFLFLILIHSTSSGNETKENEQENFAKKADQLMQKLRSQIFIDIKI